MKYCRSVVLISSENTFMIVGHKSKNNFSFFLNTVKNKC